MKTVGLWLTLMCYGTQSFGAPIVVQALGSSPEEYRAFVDNQKGKVESFVQNYLDASANSEKSQHLTELYEQGLKYFFAGSRKMAEKSFSEIIASAYDSDWHANQASMIFLSYVKLAEISPEKSETHLKHALQFHYDFSEDIPKALIPTIAKVKRALKTKIWNVSDHRQFDFILVNSQVYDLRSITKIELPVATHRITFLSNTYKPQTFKMEPAQLSMVNAPTLPIVDGDCENPNTSLETNELTVFFSRTCILTKKENNWTAYGRNKTIDLTPSTKIESIVDYHPPSEPIYKKVWFWAAVGIAAGFVILSSTKREKPAPTTETVTF